MCVSNGVLYNMPIQGRGIKDEGRELAGVGEGERASHGSECGVCVLRGSWGHMGRGTGEVWGRREGGREPRFPVPQIPSSCLRSRYTKPPLKVLETGGGMKRSH